MKFNLNNPAFLQMACTRKTEKGYLIVTSTEDGNELSYDAMYNTMGANRENVEKSLDGGKTWTDISFFVLNAGESVYFRNKTKTNLTPKTTNDEYAAFFTMSKGFNVSGDIEEFAYPEGLIEGSFKKFFAGTKVVEADLVISASRLPERCCESMFDGCTSLTKAPVLMATSSDGVCYNNMFKGCTSLIESPVLRLDVAKYYEYSFMFDGCSSLSKITCLTREFGEQTGNMENWTRGVSESGVFVKLDNAIGLLEDSVNGIPPGWTTEIYVG